VKRKVLEEVREERAAKRPVILVTDLESGRQELVRARDLEEGKLDADLLALAQEALRKDRSASAETRGRRFFVRLFQPPLRLMVVGGVHIAQALVPMARHTGFEVCLVDPRAAFASDDRFPETDLRNEWPDAALANLAPDARTAIVTLTHDPKLDDPALVAALRSPAFYIGSLGSRRTHTARLERLRAFGFGDAALARIHAPVGLAIGASSPGEIAIAILAEVVATLRLPVCPGKRGLHPHSLPRR